MTEEQIIAQEMQKLQRKNEGYGEKIVMNENEVYKALSKEFPEEALSTDNSRGFALTSVKAQYVVERLNEVLGVMNWTFGGEFKETENGVLYMGALIITVNGKQNKHFAPGFAAFNAGGKSKNLGDVYKGARTDSLSKCASMVGVANSVFKGLVSPPDKSVKRASKTVSTAKTLTSTTETSVSEDKSETQSKPSTSFATRRSRPTLTKGK